jgi:hypothetical protein
VHVWGKNKGHTQHGVLVTNLTPSNCRTYLKPISEQHSVGIFMKTYTHWNEIVTLRGQWAVKTIEVNERHRKFFPYQVVHQFDGKEQVLILGQYPTKKRWPLYSRTAYNPVKYPWPLQTGMEGVIWNLNPLAQHEKLTDQNYTGSNQVHTLDFDIL